MAKFPFEVSKNKKASQYCWTFYHLLGGILMPICTYVLVSPCIDRAIPFNFANDIGTRSLLHQCDTHLHLYATIQRLEGVCL